MKHTPDLLERLDELNITYTLHHHAPVFTVAESNALDMHIEGVHCRNMFLRDKVGAQFLITLPSATAIDLKKLSLLLSCKRLSFGTPERLWDVLGVIPGAVCPFAIMNDTNRSVSLILDAAMMEAKWVNYHPLDNTMTIGLAPRDLLRFIVSCHQAPQILDLSQVHP